MGERCVPFTVLDVDQALPAPLTRATHRYIIDAIERTRDYLLTNTGNSLNILTATIGDEDVPQSPQRFRETKERISQWLARSPPRVCFKNVESVKGFVKGVVPHFAQFSVERPGSLSIFLARSLLSEITRFAPAVERPGWVSPIRSQWWILLFVLERTLLHELGHAARFLFGNASTCGREQHGGGIGREIESCTGGEALLCVSDGGVCDLDLTLVVGLGVKTDPEETRYLGLTRGLLLQDFAAVDWASIQERVAAMPSSVPASFRKHHVLKTSDFVPPCSLWSGLEEGMLEIQRQLASPATPQFPRSPRLVASDAKE
uniref:SprT-like domain-containing protein n=1 Tax=Mycena chlorophos TaxID=658473 RepID=A0ABQ0MDJ0_MYCCL|nr:predicted protein [Mycena chlorophos]